MKNASKQKPSNWLQWLQLFFAGMCVGTADLVPGISGGTVAFILGYYEELFNSIKSVNYQSIKLLLQFRFKEAFQVIAWKFLLFFLLGIVFAMAMLASVVDFLLNHPIYREYLYAVFMGLIVASIVFCFRLIKKWKASHCLILSLGLVTAFFLCGKTISFDSKIESFDVPLTTNPIPDGLSVPISNYNLSSNALTGISQSTLESMVAKEVVSSETVVYNRSLEQYQLAKELLTKRSISFINWKFVAWGAIAICATLLPGISGSYVLVIFGVYPTLIAVLADFVSGLKRAHFDSDAFLLLFSLLCGVVIGATVMSRVISFLFKRYYEHTIALLVGFMLGALRVTWPFWSYNYVLLPLKLEKGLRIEATMPIFPEIMTERFFSVLFISMGCFLFAIALERFVAKSREKKYQDKV